MQWWAWQKSNTRHGFTIIELLVVIVVIAILAAMSMVAYVGISQRAKNAAIVATIDSWEKTLRAAAISGEPLPPTAACLGKSGDFPAGDGFALNECILVDGSGQGILYSDTNFSAWTTTSRSSGRMPMVTYHLGGSTLKGRGIWVFSHDTSAKIITIAWIAQVDGSCARGAAATTPIVGSTAGGFCALSIYY